MALNIYHEARGEPRSGWLSVAFVTLNRVMSSRWPSSVCEVVRQPYQFSWTHDGKSDAVDWTNPQAVQTWRDIKQFVEGFAHSYKYIEDPTGGANHYHAERIKPEWVESMEPTGLVGSHLFYKDR